MKKYLILGSRIALGVYVPGISLRRQLEEAGCQVDMLCLEDLYTDRDSVIEETKKSFHKDYRLAKFSYKMPTRNQSIVSPEKQQEFLERVASLKYNGVVTFSGFWIGLLNELIERNSMYEGKIFAIHMDAGYSLSWKNVKRGLIREFWLYNKEWGKVEALLETPDVGLPEEKRILVHGGGWGLGEYACKEKALNELGYKLDIIIYYPEEIDDADKMNDYYLLDPEWKPDEENAEYPRILRYKDGEWTDFSDDGNATNPLRTLMKQSMAVLSKPGGGTLSDSLVTATPLIFEEELATYEGDNKSFWISQGYGIDFNDFVKAENQDKILEEMRERILSIQKKTTRIMDVLDNIYISKKI